MEELLKLIAIHKNLKIELSRFVTAQLNYLDGGNVEFIVDNHGPVKPGIQKLVIDDSLENKGQVMQGILDIEQIQDYVNNKKHDIDEYTECSKNCMVEILQNLQWVHNVSYDDEEYLRKILDLAQNGATIKIDYNKLLRMAYTNAGTQFQILSCAKVDDKTLAIELLEDEPEKVTEILLESYTKNKELLNEKIDQQVEKSNNEIEEIKNRINTIYSNFNITNIQEENYEI